MNARPRLQVAFLTGRSDPASCHLSPLQQRFLAALAAPGRVLVPRNFPYDDDTAAHRPTPLWRAAVCNLREHLRAGRAAFAAKHAPAVQRRLDAAEHTVLLAGSCGLRLLLGLRLPAATMQRVSVFAYGNVQRRRPPGRCLVVVGRGDWLARALGGPSDVRVPGGHLQYLAQPELLAACATFLAAVERDLAGAEPTAVGAHG